MSESLLATSGADQTREGCIWPWCTSFLLGGIFVNRFIVQSQLYAVSLRHFIFLSIKTELFQIFQTKPHCHEWKNCLVISHMKTVPLSSTSHHLSYRTWHWCWWERMLGVWWWFWGFRLFFFFSQKQNEVATEPQWCQHGLSSLVV